MNKFEQAYAAANEALKTQLTGELETNRSDMRALLADGGPKDVKKAVLERIRERLELEATTARISRKAGSKREGEAQAINAAAGSKDAPGKGKKAATLKLLRHLYHGHKSGGASIWVYSPPVIYDKWVYDKITSDNDASIVAVLNQDLTEVYSKEQRKVMVDAISEARRIASNAVLKVETPNTRTNNLVRQYFTDGGDTGIDDILTTLAKGYKKIAAGLGSSSLVISDEPGDRLGGGWKDWAFIYPSEKMKVIYLQNAWLKKADEASADNSSPLHRCARTIIHEMSHKECRTEDVVYGPRGLKPHGDLTGEYALHNADSWAYFAVDVNELLNGGDGANATKNCTGIRKVPDRELTVD